MADTHEEDQSHTDHDHTAGASSRSLAIALARTTLFLIAELVGAVIFDSLALLSDAAHMFTDCAALAIALAAVKIGARPPDDERTFGYRRFEILAAAFNAILLFVVAGYVLIEGVQRFFDPQPVGSIGMPGARSPCAWLDALGRGSPPSCVRVRGNCFEARNR